MSLNVEPGWLKYLPVFNVKPPRLGHALERLTWNAGLWSNQSYDLHWMAKFAILCYFSTNLTQLFGMIIEREDTVRLFEGFSVLSFSGMGVLKLSNLHFNRERWQFLLSQVTMLENEQKHGVSDPLCLEYDTDDEEESQLPYIERYTRNYSYITKLIVKIYTITVVVFVLTPFIECALRRGSHYPHILPGWAALDQMGFFVYFIEILFEFVAAVYCVYVHFAFDCMSVGIMIFVSGQFSLLRRQTENIGGRGRDCTRDKRAELRIKRAHMTHLILRRVMEELDAMMVNILGIYYLVATLAVCSVAIRLHTQTLSNMQLASLIQYLVGILTQLFFFCRYGDAVLHASSFGMGEGPFGAAWWGLGPSIRRQLALLGVGMSQPRRLRAGPFNTLDQPSFVQILRTAYTYYAVLNQTSK